MSTLKRLSNIADELDERGLIKMSNIVTEVMRRVAQKVPSTAFSAPHALSVGTYDENAWKQAFIEKYRRFLQIAENAKNDKTPMDSIHPGQADGLYNEMMYIASNYLKNDAEVFQIMKWVTPTYQGLFKKLDA